MFVNLEKQTRSNHRFYKKTGFKNLLNWRFFCIINFITFTKIIFMKKLILSVFFQIGVNVIGLPVIIVHDLSKTVVNKSLFHK